MATLIKNLARIEIIIYLLVLLLLVVSLYFGLTDGNYFNASFAKEDGFIETLTALLLFMISVLQFSRFLKLRKQKTLLWSLGTMFFVIIFLFGAGEEISWGQRIFDIETGDYFKQNNLQNETNIHNLKIGGVKINTLIFGKLFTIGLAIYLIFSPIFYKKYRAIKNMIDGFAIPLPKLHNMAAFILATLVIVLIPDSVDRKWEVYELVFGALFFLIFLKPQNSFIFKK